MTVRLGHPHDALGWPLYLALGACLLYATPTLLGLTWQLTPSEPRGLYRLHPLPPTLPLGMLVTLPVPSSVAELVHTHGWLPRGVPLMKTVSAVTGDTVCLQEDGVWVNGTWHAPVFHELGGVTLPVVRGCWTLSTDDVFVLSTKIPNSLDSRYFGVIRREALAAQAVPLWTWE